MPALLSSKGASLVMQRACHLACPNEGHCMRINTHLIQSLLSCIAAAAQLLCTMRERPPQQQHLACDGGPSQSPSMFETAFRLWGH